MWKKAGGKGQAGERPGFVHPETALQFLFGQKGDRGL